MVLESLEAKENDKILKKNFFQNFGGFRPPKNLKRGVLGGLETPQNFEKKNFPKFWGVSTPPKTP